MGSHVANGFRARITYGACAVAASGILGLSEAQPQTAANQSLLQVTVDAPTDQQARPARRQAKRSANRGRTARAAQPATAPVSDAIVSAAIPSEAIPVGAASEKNFSGQELAARPASRVGEVLEAVPGLIVTQHSGEGKANQYFLRGFNLDHGTDLAITVDGMPVNMRTHGHGQGYADINFLIPELIGALNVKKGPYFADEGDFASAGAISIDYLRQLPKNFVEMTGGSFGYQRLVTGGSAKLGEGNLIAAFEGQRYDGPWEVPDKIKKLNGVVRYAQGTVTDGFTLTAMGYSNRWTSTDQVAQRAVDQGLIGRLGSLDPTDGGRSSRFSLSSSWTQSSDIGQTKVNAYVIHSTLQLFNNFTYFLDDPINGDQFNQFDKRTLYGLNTSQSFNMRFAGLPVETRVGLQTRGDDINVGLFKTMQRNYLSTVRTDKVWEGSVGIWADNTVRWTDWLRTTVGIRTDCFAGRVTSDTPENSGNASASKTSPKAGFVLGPWYKTEFFATAGYGLHSNDIRGATITVDPIDKTTPQDRVPLLVRSKGAEVGIRTQMIPGLTSAVAVFVLNFESELLFVGDAGTTEASRPSRRTGVEWTNNYKVLPWMSFDFDFAYTRARFSDFDPAGNFIPGAPKVVASGGITFGEATGWFGAFKGRYFGPRPLIEDDSSRSLKSLIFNARAGYRFDNGVRIQLDVFNVFNSKTNQIEYFYVSRLPGEPLDGVGDRHVHPVEPFALRVTLAGQF